MDDNELASLFQKCLCLSEAKAKETVANKKVSSILIEIIQFANAQENNQKSLASLYYILATTTTKNAMAHHKYIAHAIKDLRLLNSDQVAAAIKFCDKLPAGEQVDSTSFDVACGVGIVVSAEEIKESVKSLIEKKRHELDSRRYQIAGMLLGALRQEQPWANSLALKEELDAQILAYLGPKDERDNMKALKKKEKALNSVKTESGAAISQERRIADIAKSEKFITEGELSRLHKVGENPQINPELMTEHLKRTGGKVVTRFPPEPNGFLHIGHAKAININFGFAKHYDGITYLRYDDTNPEAELEEYFTSILDVVKWLGYTPYKVTYSSDHFQKLYELAIELIKKDKAYVCFCTGEEIYEHRGGDKKGPRTECAHRNRPIAESLVDFEKMKNREYKEGVATLRMKMDLQNPNPQMWDLVAYRVLYTPHHRTGNEWCIYPTYDYTHCLCDSFEDITHSICTLEFFLSRESYYWLLDALELYKPIQSEFGRLNLTNTVTSKRKLNTLVTEGHVSGWDDPRLHTIAAIRRRGFTPQAVNAFVREVGVTFSTVTTPHERLENYVRDHLNEIAPRLFLLLEPLKVTIENLTEEISADLGNGDGMRTQTFSKTIFIDASDFREIDDPNFFRLAPGKSVGLLRVPYPITCESFVKNSEGKVVEIIARYESSLKKPKTYIQWLNPKNATVAQCRLYSKLFLHENPQEGGDWIANLNPESLVILNNAWVESGVKGKDVGFTFQGVRMGYFCVDKDSSDSMIVLNRTVTLKEDNKKS